MKRSSLQYNPNNYRLLESKMSRNLALNLLRVLQKQLIFECVRKKDQLASKILQ